MRLLRHICWSQILMGSVVLRQVRRPTSTSRPGYLVSSTVSNVSQERPRAEIIEPSGDDLLNLHTDNRDAPEASSSGSHTLGYHCGLKRFSSLDCPFHKYVHRQRRDDALFYIIEAPNEGRVEYKTNSDRECGTKVANSYYNSSDNSVGHAERPQYEQQPQIQVHMDSRQELILCLLVCAKAQ